MEGDKEGGRNKERWREGEGEGEGVIKRLNEKTKQKTNNSGDMRRGILSIDQAVK